MNEISSEKPELVFSDLKEGRTFRPLVFTASEEMVRQYMQTVGDENPLYWDKKVCEREGFAGPVAPPGLAAIYARCSYLQDYVMPSGGVLTRQELIFEAPIMVGETVEVTATVKESYVDEKGRKRVAFLIEAVKRDGSLASEIHLYAIWPK
ncbi:MAG: MaoC family dehydratase [Candidatus Hadarchaeum sp.]